MSDDNGSSQGVHYHYHFYGYGPAEGQAPQGGQAVGEGVREGAPAGEAGYGAQASGHGPKGNGGQAGGYDAAQGGGSSHGHRGRHAAAGAFPPGFPPPGFPAMGGEMGSQAGATGAAGAGQGAQGQSATGFNWHQHPAADSLIKGLVVGAGAAYLLTNETAQRTILRTAVQVWSFLQGSVEELKERLHDAEAEVAAAATPAAPVEPSAGEMPIPPAAES